jgi:predicted PurR-regulated permease PerM
MNQNVLSTARKGFFFALLGVVTAFFLWIMSGFILPIIWAAIFALLLHPLSRWLKKHLKTGPSLSALLSILISLILVFVPIFSLAGLTANNAVALYQEVVAKGPSYIDSLGNNERIQHTLSYLGVNVVDVETWLIDGIQNASSWITSQVVHISVWTFGAFVRFLIMLYLLFFFLRDGEKFLHYLKRTVPLNDEEKEAIFKRFSSTIFAIFKGTLIVAVVQGLIGGVLFSIIGIPNAVLWGCVMAFASVLPLVGPVAVWVPAFIILFATGNFAGAAILLGGGIVVSTIDNILKPILVGRNTQMPDALILLSILGGVGTFGIVGVVLGPVIAALFLSILDIFESEYRGASRENKNDV